MEFLFPAVFFNFRCDAFLFYQTQARESYTSERYCWEKSKEGVTYKKFSSPLLTKWKSGGNIIIAIGSERLSRRME